ncbi:hypothetical protein [Bacteriovorax sp. Seq25_V]|uniref:hypothetical protein n=1 Tax=Bacteriovorax sp. Seq25_V TaxID=1201288 RepID=UPI000389E099|nr:hypothetical protein [Bacteriovorax sp. Seq25_V]EQC45565.1 hypothetical protein M900_2237 [Bacteriovorax sp. Seq25_V]
MKVYSIVSSMIIILIILFICVGAWRRREVTQSVTEVEYFEKINKLVNEKKSFDEIYHELTDVLEKYFKSSDEKYLRAKLEADLKILGIKK